MFYLTIHISLIWISYWNHWMCTGSRIKIKYWYSKLRLILFTLFEIFQFFYLSIFSSFFMKHLFLLFIEICLKVLVWFGLVWTIFFIWFKIVSGMVLSCLRLRLAMWCHKSVCSAIVSSDTILLWNLCVENLLIKTFLKKPQWREE